MAAIEELARAALAGDSLAVRSLAQDLLRDERSLADIILPATHDPRLLAVAAGLLDLLADRSGQVPPAWVADVGPAPESIYLLRSAQSMRHLRALCELEAPAQLRKRRVYAPPNYLVFA
jgi:hypothetical protein